MSRAAEVTLLFADEERLFRLPIGRWRAVQERCDAGPLELLRRYTTSAWRVDDIREVILQGLVGGGLPVAEASKALATHFDGLPLAQFVPVAQAIVMASVVGTEDEDDAPGEPRARKRTQTPSRAEKSGSPASTARAPRSASPRAKSTT